MSWHSGGVELLSLDRIDPRKLAAIESLSFDVGEEGEAVRIRMRDSLRALELLGRHLGLFEGSAKNATANREAATGRLFEAIDRFAARIWARGGA